MRIRTHMNATGRREGVVLLIVITMLALFAVVALSFVYYADAEATNSQLARQTQAQFQPELEPELLLSYFMSQQLYDAPYESPGLASALRGHSLARTMYGYNPYALNTTPFHGVGRLHYALTHPSPIINTVDD